jgi:hypothetical protein
LRVDFTPENLEGDLADLEVAVPDSAEGRPSGTQERDLLVCCGQVNQLYRDGRIYSRRVAGPLPRYTESQVELERRLARILVETGEQAPTAANIAGATAAGDARRLRGIPAHARGISGAIAGTDPLRALLAKESRRRRG